MRKIFVQTLFLFMLVLALTASTQAAEKLKIGILPQQDAVKTLKLFQPLADYLSAKVGVPMEVVTSPNFDAFMDRVRQNQFDLIYLNPYHYVIAHNAAGYEAFAMVKQDGLTKFRGIFVTRKDSPIKSIQDLRGKTIIYADDTSLAGYLLQKVYLQDNGINPDKETTAKFAGKHDSAIMAVYNRTVEVAGVREPALALLKDKIDLNQLNILAETDWMPQLPFAAKKQLDPQLVQKIAAAFTALDPGGEPGATILKNLNFDGFVPAKDSDYDPLRAFAKKLNLPVR
ncbi:MAG: phosphate/phosphite/phosphonate ABC transporter substrate-binding protein [Syntrophothermus sp.]